MSQPKSVRFDRRIDIEWLDAAAANVALGSDSVTIRTGLSDLLEGQVAGGRKRGTSCHKTVGILCGVWLDVDPGVRGVRDRAIAMLPSLSPLERKALHWSLLLAGFPFFAEIARNAGRLLGLQGSLSMAQLTRRMRESWGDRSTMDKAAQRVMRSMVQWGFLVDEADKGVYAREKERVAVSGELAGLLLEGLLINEGKTIPVVQAATHPALFPFDVSLNSHGLRQSSQFEVHRQGLDMDVVGLAEG
jgi:hypothetical protein